MRRLVVFAVALVLCSTALFAAGQGQAATGGRASNELNLYYSHAADWTDPIIREFQERTGIRVNLVGAGTGELAARIRAESRNPLGDVLWGGGSDSYQAIIDYLQPYEHAHMGSVFAETRDPGNRWHGTSIDPMVLIYNPKLVRPEQAPRSWADLMDPRFQGQIAHADPVRSGSAFMALINQLETQGGINDAGWANVRRFIDNIEGKVLASSSGTFRGVAAGEYAVGITYEEAALKYQAEGADLRVVYPVEGTAPVPSPIAIINGAKNLENAQRFVDFILSPDVQSRLGDVHRRSVRNDIALPSSMKPTAELGNVPYDTAWLGQNKDRILDQWKEMIVAR